MPIVDADDLVTRRAVRTTGIASLGLVLVALPMFMVSGLAVQIRAEFGFSEAAFGAALSVAFACAALSAPLVSRIADAHGAKRAIYAGAVLAAMSMVGLGVLADTWWHLALLLAISGIGVAVTDPGLTVLVARDVPLGRQGLAFGIKEASIPLASLTAGLAIPVIALTVGWRWALLVAVLPLAGLIWLMAGVDESRPTRGIRAANAQPRDISRGMLVMIVAATATGMVAASGAGVFVPQSAVAMGLSPAAAGFLLAAGSAAGIATRIGMGIVADHRVGGQFLLVAVMLACGAGSMLLGTLGGPAPVALATIGTFSVGWSWSGLLFLSLVRAMPGEPGLSAGIAIAGLSGGNALGPFVFGVIAGNVSYEAAWLSSAILAALAAALMVTVHWRIANSTPAGTS